MKRGVFIIAMTLAGVAGCAADESISGFVDAQATYVLVDINEAPFPARATIAFPSPGQVTGRGPCNSYRAAQTVPYPWISIEAIASTRVACPDLNQETVFFATLREMTEVEVAGGLLLLSNAEGASMLFEVEAP